MKIDIPGCLHLSVESRRWFVLRCKGGWDFRAQGSVTDAVFADLVDAKYEAYVPRRRFEKHNRRLRVLSERSEAVLPGYVFVVHPRAGRPVDDWTEIVGVKGVNGIDGVLGPLMGSDGPLRIADFVIEALMRDEFEGQYDDTVAGKRLRGETARQRLEARFPIGSTMRVADGPFAGFPAHIESVTQADRIRALVDIFGRMTTTEFDPGELEEAPPPRAA